MNAIRYPGAVASWVRCIGLGIVLAGALLAGSAAGVRAGGERPEPIGPLPIDRTDSDDDWIADYWEMVIGIDPGDPDTDDDGLSDGEEILGSYGYITGADTPDTDGDGLKDGEEIYAFGTNPLSADSEGDGLGDYDEVVIYRTNPLYWDTDNDWHSDAAEVRNGTDPNDFYSH